MVRFDMIDLKILKHMFRKPHDIYYLSEMTQVLQIKKSMLRLRIKKLCRVGLVREIKSYPNYYVPNTAIKERVDEIKVPVFNIR